MLWNSQVHSRVMKISLTLRTLLISVLRSIIHNFVEVWIIRSKIVMILLEINSFISDVCRWIFSYSIPKLLILVIGIDSQLRSSLITTLWVVSIAISILSWLPVKTILLLSSCDIYRVSYFIFCKFSNFLVTQFSGSHSLSTSITQGWSIWIIPMVIRSWGIDLINCDWIWLMLVKLWMVCTSVLVAISWWWSK